MQETGSTDNAAGPFPESIPEFCGRVIIRKEQKKGVFSGMNE